MAHLPSLSYTSTRYGYSHAAYPAEKSCFQVEYLGGRPTLACYQEGGAMAFDLELYLDWRRKYLENRPNFPLDELAKYAGSWIAWSPDGTKIVASTTNPDELEDSIRSSGEDPQYCVVEGIPEYDSMLGDLHARSS
jgi:hypothetical protein